MLVGCFLQRTVDWRWVFVCFQASGKNLNLNDESQHGLLMQLLKLSYNCLNYDFIGTSTDESSDDLCTVQIPTSWRSGSCAERDLITDVWFKGTLCIDWCVYYWSHVSRTWVLPVDLSLCTTITVIFHSAFEFDCWNWRLILINFQFRIEIVSPHNHLFIYWLLLQLCNYSWWWEDDQMILETKDTTTSLSAYSQDNIKCVVLTHDQY